MLTRGRQVEVWPHDRSFEVVTAQAVAARLGIDEVEAEVLPQDKAAVVPRRS